MTRYFMVLLGLVWSVFCHGASTHPAGNGCSKQVWRKLNADKVCFGAADGTSGKFMAQYGMNTFSWKYVHRSGFHQCEYGFGGYFGCEMFPHSSGSSDHPHKSATHVHHVHHYHSGPSAPSHHRPYGYYDDEGEQDDAPANDEPANDQKQADEPAKQADQPANDEPQYHGDEDPIRGPGPQYLHQVSVWLTDKDDDVLMPQPPYSGAYFTVPGLQRPAWDTSIEIPVYNGPMMISKDQELHLFHGEDLFDIDTSDNTGQLCIDIYAYGDLVYPQ